MGDDDAGARGLSRRGLLAGIASGALVAAVACASDDADRPGWDREVDVVVVGALAAAVAGAEVLVLEKRVAPGGSTAMSGGVAWVPNNHAMAAEGIEDSRNNALV